MTAWPTLEQVENAFLPAREIISADRFAGRRTQLQAAYLGLIGDGTNVAIVGNRGIGKTSLARQLLNIAGGNLDLLDRLNIEHGRAPDFLTVYLACGSDTANIKQLLQKLLTNKACLGDWVYDVKQGSKLLGSIAPKFNVSIPGIGGIGAELGSGSTESQSAPATKDHDIETVFTNVVAGIVAEKAARDGVLIVVDEFDQIADRSGFAPFLKSLATNVPQVKFCVVGVAQNLRELMAEHPSADRLFAGGIVSMPPMSDPELKEIVELAQQSIGDTVLFHVDAVSKILALAQGHPYMVHLIGKYALRLAFLRKAVVVAPEDIDATLKNVAEREADPILEGRYKKCVQASVQREVVLRTLAEMQDAAGEVLTTQAYPRAIERGVENPSQYVGHLVSEAYGAEIRKVRERYYSFKDSLFRAYVLARPPALDPKRAFTDDD